jgi:peptidoglycan/LPS O-acetylase OafA/YrhL
VWGYSALNWLFALSICSVVQGGGGWLQRGLENRCLTYIGRVSYGLYLFHLPMIALVEWSQKAFGRPLSAYTSTALTFALTLGVASASYHLFEVRFLRLKEVLFSKAGDRAIPLSAPLRKAA